VLTTNASPTVRGVVYCPASTAKSLHPELKGNIAIRLLRKMKGKQMVIWATLEPQVPAITCFRSLSYYLGWENHWKDQVAPAGSQEEA
jgi:hypothetical protein